MKNWLTDVRTKLNLLKQVKSAVPVQPCVKKYFPSFTPQITSSQLPCCPGGEAGRFEQGTIATTMAAAALTFFFATCSLSARDIGQWASVDPTVYNWFQSLMQPDYPTISCCGSADAYYADSFESDGDRYVAVITDTRDDKALGRHHVEPGTRITVPNAKLKTDSGNPTGHGVIFLSSSDTVFCYVSPGGT